MSVFEAMVNSVESRTNKSVYSSPSKMGNFS